MQSKRKQLERNGNNNTVQHSEKIAGPEIKILRFDMSKPEITEDIKNDLQMLKYRSVLDNKTFMKGSDRRGHKYFQIGTIMDSAEVRALPLKNERDNILFRTFTHRD